MASVPWQVVLDPFAQIMSVVRAAVQTAWDAFGLLNFSRSWQLSSLLGLRFIRLRWKHSYEMKESIGDIFDANHFCFILL
jgi:hypothetical protein